MNPSNTGTLYSMKHTAHSFELISSRFPDPDVNADAAEAVVLDVHVDVDEGANGGEDADEGALVVRRFFF